MSKTGYGLVRNTIWRSRRFKALPNRDARMFYLYLLTCPHRNRIGCFALPLSYAANDLGMTIDEVESAVEACSAIPYRNDISRPLIRYFEAEELVYIDKFIESDPPNSPKTGKSFVDAALDLPDCELKHLVFQDLKAITHTKDLPEVEAFQINLSIPSGNDIDMVSPLPLTITNPITSTSTGTNTVPHARDAREDDPPASQPDEISIAIDEWNALAGRINRPKVQDRSDSRKRLLRQRLDDVGGLEGWREALACIERSPLMRGEEGRAGWKVTFDWLVKASNFTKVMEGNYEPDTSAHRRNAPPRNQGKPDLAARAMELAREADERERNQP